MKSNARWGATSMMQPLWISKDPCIIEEKGKLIKWEGGGVGVSAPDFEGLKIISAGKDGGREGVFFFLNKMFYFHFKNLHYYYYFYN